MIPFLVEIEFGFRFEFKKEELEEYTKLIKNIITRDNSDLPIRSMFVHYKNDQELQSRLERLDATFGNDWITDGIINISIY